METMEYYGGTYPDPPEYPECEFQYDAFGMPIDEYSEEEREFDVDGYSYDLENGII